MNSQTRTAPRTEIDLEKLGLEHVAYLRRALMDGVQGFSIHAADGRIIGFAPDMAQALGAIIQNNMEAVPLH